MELNSLRLIMRQREQLRFTLTGNRKRLGNVTEREEFWSAMVINQRLAMLVDRFLGAAMMVMCAIGSCRIQFVIVPLPATLVVLEPSWNINGSGPGSWRWCET